MELTEPVWLWALFVPFAVAVLYAVALATRRGLAVRLADLELLDAVAPDRSGWRRHLAVAVLVVGLVALVIGLTRPVIDRSVPDERATVVLAVDVSLSMSAADVEPDRLDAAQDAARTFLDELPEGIGTALIAFAGNAQPLVAPTDDRDVVRAALGGLRLGEGTAIGEAIFVALDLVAEEEAQADGAEVPAQIIVLSDGETTVGRDDADAVAAANEAGITVSTIAFGTDSGVVRLPDGTVVPVPVDADALRSIAEEGGGVFFEALTADELDDAFGDLGSSVGRTTEERDISTPFLAAGLVAAGLAAAASLWWFGRLT